MRHEQHQGIKIPPTLPFQGEDIWNAYEFSWLNCKGKPVIALATFIVPAESPRIFESKSLKLYLHSFNASRFHNESEVSEILCKDLKRSSRRPSASHSTKLGTLTIHYDHFTHRDKY
ncbi:tunnelling fold family protein [Legionella tunisiensis]|uniref:hypothetical protein n=1 Tax=Legionella tunisiensis TaxID=1034944 RepID=UPI0004749659|nr:hypothetical protein [Legionella tunisiensis]